MFHRSTLFFSLFLVGACESTGFNPPTARRNPDAMLQLSMDDMMRPDLAEEPTPGEDLGTAPRPDLAGTGGGSTCTVVVNEVLTATTDSPDEEWIELYYPCSTAVKLASWTLRYRSAGNNSSPTTMDIILVEDLSKTIDPGKYLLWGGDRYSGTKDGLLQNKLADAGGGVALVDPKNFIIDSVAYGTAINSHNFIETAKTTAAPTEKRPGKTIARTPDGTDTDDNSQDFQVATPTPRAAN
jgi:hypothetical protein